MTETLKLTANDIKALWKEKTKQLETDPEKRIELLIVATTVGDEGAYEALKDFVRLGAWAKEYGISALAYAEIELYKNESKTWVKVRDALKKVPVIPK